MTIRGWMTGVLICYFIVALPPHGHDGPFTLVLPWEHRFFCFFLEFYLFLLCRPIQELDCSQRTTGSTHDPNAQKADRFRN